MWNSLEWTFLHFEAEKRCSGQFCTAAAAPDKTFGWKIRGTHQIWLSLWNPNCFWTFDIFILMLPVFCHQRSKSNYMWASDCCIHSIFVLGGSSKAGTLINISWRKLFKVLISAGSGTGTNLTDLQKRENEQGATLKWEEIVLLWISNLLSYYYYYYFVF